MIMEVDDHILLGVAGSPVLHSRSPLMFKAIFQNIAIDGSYIRCAVRSADEAVRLIRELDFRGMNITAPFKESITPHLDYISDDVKSIGAVNTILNSEGRLSGFNTDHMGVTEPLELKLGDLTGKKALILGAGGAGIAAAYGLKSKGADVLILNKFDEQGAAAAAKTGTVFKNLKFFNEEIASAEIIINTIPYEIGALDISEIQKGTIFLDAGYKKSHYSALSAKYGFDFIGGEEWLVHQGIYACGHFLSFLPSADLLASALEAGKERKKIISLTGFMASGKSSVGISLATKLGYEFADTDTIIEQKQSMSINDIFLNYGEEKFRQIESDVLLSFQGRSDIVLSCGGGAVLREENRKFLMNETVPFWLYTSMKETLKRAYDGTRPLLSNMERPEQLMELFLKRKHLYASLFGTLVISEGAPEKIAELINEEICLSF